MEITPELLLRAYACGVFPMADSRDSPELFWVDPQRRGILPFERFHIPTKLRRLVRRDAFRVTADRAFGAVMEACSQPRKDHDESWINQEILHLYSALFDLGAAHSIECWDDDELVGGLYGVDLAGAFFGESMFHRRSNASKVALVHLVGRLIAGGYRLLDTQFVTDHLRQFGVQEIARDRYHRLLAQALTVKADFYSLPSETSGEMVLQSVTQIS